MFRELQLPPPLLAVRLLAAASGTGWGEGGWAAPGIWFTGWCSGVEVDPGSYQGSGPELWSRLWSEQGAPS